MVELGPRCTRFVGRYQCMLREGHTSLCASSMPRSETRGGLRERAEKAEAERDEALAQLNDKKLLSAVLGYDLGRDEARADLGRAVELLREALPEVVVGHVGDTDRLAAAIEEFLDGFPAQEGDCI